LPKDAEDDLGWVWPSARHRWLAAFEEGKNKGMAITGKAGDPVLAAADGRVVYAGSGLRGYGNLVIVKHNNNLPHRLRPQPGLAGEGRPGRAPWPEDRRDGVNSDSDRVQLHFEIRRQGKPVDPARLLPPR
jgi:lipoprotein NlpD